MMADAEGGGGGDQGAAAQLIGKANFIVKFMAILQNPGKFREIMKSPKLTPQSMKEHYGTDDPKKVALSVRTAPIQGQAKPPQCASLASPCLARLLVWLP